MLDADGEKNASVLSWHDGDRRFSRHRQADAVGVFNERILVRVEHDRPSSAHGSSLLAHEFALKEYLDPAWAVLPLDLVHTEGQTTLVLDGYQGAPLHCLIDGPMKLEPFLRLGVALMGAVSKLHESGLIHKDIKPVNVLAKTLDDVRLTGFGLASCLPRERQTVPPPEVLAGTLPYMAPEQTGRMNRSVDARSDLYSCGVLLYELITGHLPFRSEDPIGWVHAHMARNATPPHERDARIPAVVSAIVMRLLAKTPEDRYNTAAGVARDFRRCLDDLSSDGVVGTFPLGEWDRPKRLTIPERLLGRAEEMEFLLSAFAGVASTGAPALVCVAGPAGAGKSSVLNELRRAMLSAGAFVASGKLEQGRSTVPYGVFAQAFQGLARMLLGMPEAELAPWRSALSEALGPYGSLLLELVPELELVVGAQPQVVELSAPEAQRRFNLVVRRFVSVFARAEHPLALLLEDGQWMDPASLDLLGELLTAGDVRHLLLVASYREEEADSVQRLTRRCEALRKAGAMVRTLALVPLGVQDVRRLVAESLQETTEAVSRLADLVMQKTAGNPFFAIQFLNELVEEGLLVSDAVTGRWRWDEDRSHAKSYSDNVAGLVARRLERLPEPTRRVLQRLACMGHVTDVATLATICDLPPAAADGAMRHAVQQELVCHRGDEYLFAHDRILEAAYAAVPEAERASIHLDIGRRLLASAADCEKERVFEIVHQLNQGAGLIASRTERERVAALNLLAGRRSKAATAYSAALAYLDVGAELCPIDVDEFSQPLRFAIALEQAECSFLTGDTETAEARLARLSTQAANGVQAAGVAGLRIDVYIALASSDRAIDICLGYLRQTGTEWAPHPTLEEARAEYERVISMLDGRQVEELVDLPFMTDLGALATMEVMTKAQVSASLVDVNLFSLMLWRMVAMSLQYGNTDASCQAYVHLGRVAGPIFGDPELGRRFAQLGYELVERGHLRRHRARTYLTYAAVSLSWAHLRSARDLIRRAFDAAHSVGDLPYAAFSCHHLISNLLAAGDPLSEVQTEAERCLAFAQAARFDLESELLAAQLAFIRMLRGEGPKFGVLDNEQFNEREFEERLAREPGLAFVAAWYWVRKLQARFLAGEHDAGTNAAGRADRLLSIAPSMLRTSECRFFAALNQASEAGHSPGEARGARPELLASHLEELGEWARKCPENFADRKSLLGAEVARMEGRELDAQRLYEFAVRSARDSGFVHHRAIACELAARFHADRGLQTIARAYLREARLAYLEWGATGKVRQLDRLFPHLRQSREPSLSSTISTTEEQLDLVTLIKVSQGVSSEIVLEDLMDTIMRAAIEQAGAERALLILSRGERYRVEAEARIAGESVNVTLSKENADEASLPRSILHYVLRTREDVLLDDAAVDMRFGADPYVAAGHSRSIMCLPLVNKTRLLGALYLENRLSPGVFGAGRVSMLKLLASVAAISLESGGLYRDLVERDAKIHRLFSANIIGIFTWHLDGRILDANEAFLRMVGYTLEDLKSGTMNWKGLLPPEWDPNDDQRMEELKATGVTEPFEADYIRKDGVRVPTLVGAALFDAKPTEGVAFVLDLTQQKAAESAARDSLKQYHEVQMRLADANRISSVGQLSASIAHEINQPLAGIRANADASLRMLAAEPPDNSGAALAARRTIRDVERASEVITRLRKFFRRNPSDPEMLDFNELVREVIDMSISNMRMGGIVVETRLAGTLPTVMGDRVQLQQVVMNLLRNALDAVNEVKVGTRKIVVTTQAAGEGMVQLSVKDTGPGLHPQIGDKLFEPFQTTKQDGMGVGLSLSRSIVERHHGRLWVANDGEPGATFHCTLPVTQESAENQIVRPRSS